MWNKKKRVPVQDGAFNVMVEAVGPANCPDPCTDDIDVSIGEGSDDSDVDYNTNDTIKTPPTGAYQYVRWASVIKHQVVRLVVLFTMSFKFLFEITIY